MNETVLRSEESLGGKHLDQHKGKDLPASRTVKSTAMGAEAWSRCSGRILSV